MQLFLLRNIRLFIYILSLYVGLFIYFSYQNYNGALRLSQWYGLVSLILLYLTLLISPLYHVFRRLPYKPIAIQARRALGLCAFFFTLPHAYYGFFRFVGGFEGIKYWGNDYVLSLLYGLAATIILAFLAITSFDYLMNRLGKKWKLIHRGIYIAAFLTFIHLVSVTIHILNLRPFMIVTYLALLFLLLLESLRLDHFLQKRKFEKRYWITSIILPIFLVFMYWSFFLISHHRH